jgi:hypothetical protein
MVSKYSKPSPIRINWGWKVIRISEAKGSLKRPKKKLTTQINVKFNDVSSTDENNLKNIAVKKGKAITVTGSEGP